MAENDNRGKGRSKGGERKSPPRGDGAYGANRSYKQDERPYKKSERSYKTGDKPPYQKDERPYNKSERPYNTGDKAPYRKDERPYNKSERPYNTGDKVPYRKDERPYNKSERPQGERRSYHDAPYRESPQKRAPTPPPDGFAAPAAVEAPALPYFLMGRNAVREAIRSGRSIDRILVVQEQDGSLGELITMARARGIVIRQTERKKLDELCMPFGHNNKTGNHQGIIAMVPDVEYVTLEDILAYAKEKNEPPFLLLLDEINDPHNLGSMLRSAACAGVHGVVLPKRRAASVTTAVAKASAGAVEYIKIAKVVNLSAAIATLKKEGVWIAGADMQGQPMTTVDLKGALALVVGNEAEGLSRLIKTHCDHLVAIPMHGEIQSLNASVAAAVLLFEKNRQDGR